MDRKMIRKRESGQILVILTVGIVALLGFLALAIDVGMIYSDRRYDQNAADASSFAGAGAAAMSLENRSIIHSDFLCSKDEVADVIEIAKDHAQSRAISNYFTIDRNISSQHGVEVYCYDSGGPFDPKYLDVYTMVSSELQTSFAHLFYEGPVRNTVDAKVRVNIGSDAGFGYALATLSDDCSKELEFRGGGSDKITLLGSGAHSNGCIYRNGNVKVEADMSKSVTFALPQIGSGSSATQGYINKGVANSITPTPTRLAAQIPRPDFDDIAASCGPSKGSVENIGNGNTRTINPGTWETWVIKNKETLVLEPGLYCMNGSISMTGGTLTGDGVTIVMLKAGLNINGGDIVLKAPSAPGTEDLSYRNLLIYAMTTNKNEHTLLGNGGSQFAGSIIIPNGSIEIGGTPGVTTPVDFSTQIVADYITVHGTAQLYLSFDQNAVWRMPSTVSLFK